MRRLLAVAAAVAALSFAALPAGSTSIYGTFIGASPVSGYHLAGGSAAGTNATNVKNSAGTLFYIIAQNPTTSVAYLRMYNTSSAPTCSSSTGVVHDYAIGAAPATGQANGFVLPVTIGESYATGISFCLTGAVGDTDTTNAPAGVTVDIGYE